MDYSKEEIAFINFCIQYVKCDDECPAVKCCIGEQRPCENIPKKMEASEELSTEEKGIIKNFLLPDYWMKNDCIPKGTREKCSNVEICDEKMGKYVCAILLDKLGIPTSEQYQILEKEIQKIIIDNLRDIDWGVGEKIIHYGHEVIVDVGRIDILLFGENSKTLYIVELKPEEGTREHVGQLLSYVAWYKEHMPSEVKSIKGILLARKFDNKATYAVKAAPDLLLKRYSLSVNIEENT